MDTVLLDVTLATTGLGAYLQRIVSAPDYGRAKWWFASKPPPTVAADRSPL